jgi:cell division protein ZapA (FtsZ GTPase activity inhibitor)
LSKPGPRSIDVEIYDQKYSIVLKSAISEADFRELAETVDVRMREIAAVASTPDSLKIAVLTALHLAQELREHQAYAEQEAILCKKTIDWTRTLEQLLSK